MCKDIKQAQAALDRVKRHNGGMHLINSDYADPPNLLEVYGEVIEEALQNLIAQQQGDNGSAYIEREQVCDNIITIDRDKAYQLWARVVGGYHIGEAGRITGVYFAKQEAENALDDHPLVDDFVTEVVLNPQPTPTEQEEV